MLLGIDLYLSDSLTHKYAGTNNPHVRISEPVISPQPFPFALVLATHNHTDHLDPETLRPIFEGNTKTKLIAPASWRFLAAERASIPPADVIAMSDGDTKGSTKYLNVKAVPAAHDQIERDAEGHCKCLGYVIQLGTRMIYHSGDTVVYPGMVELLRPHNIDIAILPINGKLGNMNGVEAARLAKDIGAKIVIPCHYDMFEFNTADPHEQFVPECERIGQAYRVLKMGERFTYPEVVA